MQLPRGVELTLGITQVLTARLLRICMQADSAYLYAAKNTWHLGNVVMGKCSYPRGFPNPTINFSMVFDGGKGYSSTWCFSDVTPCEVGADDLVFGGGDLIHFIVY